MKIGGRGVEGGGWRVGESMGADPLREGELRGRWR